MGRCPITSACLDSLSDLVGLHYFNVSRSNFTDEGCDKFSKLKSLKVLNMGFNDISDAVLAHLKGLTNLESLNLDSCMIKDGGLVHLSGHLIWMFAKLPMLVLQLLQAQKLLDDILEKSLQVVTHEPTEVVEDDSIANGGGGVRLFRDAPIGIVFYRANDYQGPLKRPRIIPKEEVDEKSKKFRQQIKLATVDGNDIIASAKQAREKFLAKLAAREAAAKLKAQKEEERIAELKKIRGERWLPAIARQMRLK